MSPTNLKPDTLPPSVPERARRLLRTWHAIRPNDQASTSDFRAMVSLLIQEDPARFDETIRAAATLVVDLDNQAAFRRDVMARTAHLEGLADNGKVAVRADAFVLPMAGDRAAMNALTENPQALLRLIEGLSVSGRFEPSDVALLDLPLRPEMANSSWMAHSLAHVLGLSMLMEPSDKEEVTREDEQSLAEAMSPYRAESSGQGVAILAGVRVWYGEPDQAPDEGDLLVDPEQARARLQVETEQAWQDIVLEVLALAELPPGSIAILPPATPLRGLAQLRALEQIHGIHAVMQANGTHDRFAMMANVAEDNGMLRCVAMDSEGQVLASGPEVNLAEIHAEGQCFLATFAREQDQQGLRTRQTLRRRGLH